MAKKSPDELPPTEGEKKPVIPPKTRPVAPVGKPAGVPPKPGALDKTEAGDKITAAPKKKPPVPSPEEDDESAEREDGSEETAAYESTPDGALTAEKPRKPAKPEKGAIQAEKPAKPVKGEKGIQAEKPVKSKPKSVKKAVGVWGIDLGQCGLKAIRLAEEDGKIVATAFDFVEHPKILSQPDADPDALTREALEKFLSRNQIKGDMVAISVPGQSGLARFVKLPPVEEKKIGDIVRFEAKQQIPFNLDEVVWDYQKLGSGIVTDGFALDTEIGLFAIKRDMVNKYLQHFKEVNVDIHFVQMAPLALCNYVAFDLLNKDPGSNADEGGERSCIVALDIGTDSSNLIITDGGRIIWQRPIPLGGNHFTRALTKDMKLTFAKAEHLKRNAMKSPELKQILASIKPVLSDFVSEVQRSLGYFTNTHRDVQIQYMLGLGNAFRLPGLQRFLAEKLQLEVRKVEKLERVTGSGVVDSPVFNENLLSFAVAYGLAIQGLQKSRLQTNLLPQEIRTERMIKAKKPFAVAAAAVLLVCIGSLAFGYGKQWRGYGDPDIAKTAKKGEDVRKAIKDTNDKFSRAKAEALKEQNAIASIIAGQSEQMFWLHLNQFLDDIVPRPEHCFPIGKDDKGEPIYNLPKEALPYIKDAQEAYEQEWKRWREGKPPLPGKPRDEEVGDGLDRLIQFNIEAVSCRYATKLDGLWGKLDEKIKNKQRRFIMPTSDIDKPLSAGDKGWVVELRGYTFHAKKEVFVQDVLMENIVRKAAELGPNWPASLEKPAGVKPPDPKPTEPVAPPMGKPAPDAKPGTPPTAPAAGGGRPISHVMLVRSANKPATGNAPFEIIGATKLDEFLVAPGADAKPGPGQPGAAIVPGGQTPTAPPIVWRPLGGESITRPTIKTDSQPIYERTEFVIFFIFREDNSKGDPLMKPKSQPQGTPRPGGPGGPGVPGQPGGPGQQGGPGGASGGPGASGQFPARPGQ